jgi:hypothetical protein
VSCSYNVVCGGHVVNVADGVSMAYASLATGPWTLCILGNRREGDTIQCNDMPEKASFINLGHYSYKERDSRDKTSDQPRRQSNIRSV